MIRKKSEIRTQQNENMRGGNGIVFLEHLLEKEEFYDKGRLFSKITLKPGCSIGYHIHENEMEAYYILKGSALYDDNGSKVTVNEGDVTVTKCGESHGISNNSNEDIELIAIILYK